VAAHRNLHCCSVFCSFIYTISYIYIYIHMYMRISGSVFCCFIYIHIHTQKQLHTRAYIRHLFSTPTLRATAAAVLQCVLQFHVYTYSYAKAAAHKGLHNTFVFHTDFAGYHGSCDAVGCSLYIYIIKSG